VLIRAELRLRSSTRTSGSALRGGWRARTRTMCGAPAAGGASSRQPPAARPAAGAAPSCGARLRARPRRSQLRSPIAAGAGAARAALASRASRRGSATSNAPFGEGPRSSSLTLSTSPARCVADFALTTLAREVRLARNAQSSTRVAQRPGSDGAARGCRVVVIAANATVATRCKVTAGCRRAERPASRGKVMSLFPKSKASSNSAA
jgi:hypothetical protein